jgi:hypothetical protein
MAEKQKGTKARGAAKKAGARKKAPSQSLSQNAAAPKGDGKRGAAKNAAARKKTVPKGTGSRAGSGKRTSQEERFRLIQEAAYFKAEEQGFNCDPSECWLLAEAEIDARLTTPH